MKLWTSWSILIDRFFIIFEKLILNRNNPASYSFSVPNRGFRSRVHQLSQHHFQLIRGADPDSFSLGHTSTEILQFAFVKDSCCSARRL